MTKGSQSGQELAFWSNIQKTLARGTGAVELAQVCQREANVLVSPHSKTVCFHQSLLLWGKRNGMGENVDTGYHSLTECW